MLFSSILLLINQHTYIVESLNKVSLGKDGIDPLLHVPSALQQILGLVQEIPHLVVLALVEFQILHHLHHTHLHGPLHILLQ